MSQQSADVKATYMVQKLHFSFLFYCLIKLATKAQEIFFH